MTQVVLLRGPLAGVEVELPDPGQEIHPQVFDKFDEPVDLGGYYVRHPKDHEFQPWVYIWRTRSK